MGQPVKLSDKLVLEARLAGEDNERSIAGQIEHWARLGRAVESLLRPANVVQLKRRAEVKPVEHYLEVIRKADSPEGRTRLKAVLDAEPFPHFEPTSDPQVMTRIDEDGTRTKVEWRDHDWVPLRKHK
jgi:hypothetical protein